MVRRDRKEKNENVLLERRGGGEDATEGISIVARPTGYTCRKVN